MALVHHSRSTRALHYLAPRYAVRAHHCIAEQRSRTGRQAKRSLAKLVLVTVGVYSLLGHKEFPLPSAALACAYGVGCIRPGCVLWRGRKEKVSVAGAETWTAEKHMANAKSTPSLATTHLAHVATHGSDLPQHDAWRCAGTSAFRTWTHLPLAAEQLTAVDAEVEFGPGFGRIHNFGFLMPCHSTPWATHLHDKELVEKKLVYSVPTSTRNLVDDSCSKEGQVLGSERLLL